MLESHKSMHKYKILYEFVQWANSETELSFRNWLITKYKSIDNACNQIISTSPKRIIEHQEKDNVFKEICALDYCSFSFKEYQNRIVHENIPEDNTRSKYYSCSEQS